MKIRRWVVAALLSGVVGAGAGLAAPEHNKAKESTALEEQMDHLSSAFRKLRRQAGEAAKNESSLELVATMRKAAKAAQQLPPAKAADLPEPARAKFIAAYQEQMMQFITVLDSVETALKAGNNAEALKRVGELGAMQKSGHKEYKKPDRD